MKCNIFQKSKFQLCKIIKVFAFELSTCCSKWEFCCKNTTYLLTEDDAPLLGVGVSMLSTHVNCVLVSYEKKS